MPVLGILADGDDQLDLRHRRDHRFPPLGRAFRAGRQVATLRVLTGEAEAHRHDGDTGAVVKHLGCQIEPLPQAVARGVGEGDAAGVHTGSRRLPGNQDPRCRRGPDDGARLMWQGLAQGRLTTEATGANLLGQGLYDRLIWGASTGRRPVHDAYLRVNPDLKS